MAMQVKWNKKADLTFSQALEYGSREFGEKAAKAFYQDIKQYAARLTDNPLLGKPEPLLNTMKSEYRSLKVHKHFKLIYHIVGTTLRIADLWDTRREPTSLTGRL